MFPYFISISILSEITGTKPHKLRKMYAQILDNACIPLTEIPFDQQEAYVKSYLLRDCYVDIDLMNCSLFVRTLKTVGWVSLLHCWKTRCLLFDRNGKKSVSPIKKAII